MKFKEIKQMNKDDLIKKVVELKKELMKLRAQVATGTTPQNSGRINQIRKIIAKAKTVQ